MKDIAVLLGGITGLLTLLKPNEKKQNRKSIRQALKMYRKIKRIMKKDDGVITPDEKTRLNEIENAIVDATIKNL
jgi:hypothetical protein